MLRLYHGEWGRELPKVVSAFSVCNIEREGGGGGGGVMTFVLSMCVNFAILAGTVSRVMYKI